MTRKGQYYQHTKPNKQAGHVHFYHYSTTIYAGPFWASFDDSFAGYSLPFIRDDGSLSAGGLSNSQVAWVASAFSLAYGIGQLPGGWLADRIGRRAMIAIGVFGVAIIGILVGLSTTYLLLILLLVVMGIVGGGYHPAATPWISASVGEQNQGRAIGFHFVGGGAGFFVAPFIGGAIAAAWGWLRPSLSWPRRVRYSE
jgi:MFS family permease